MKSVNAFLVDIGNVLLSFDFRPFIEKTARRDGPSFDPEAIFARILPHRMEFESGALSETEFFEHCKAILGYDGDWAGFRKAYCEIFRPVPAMWEWVDSVSASHRLVLFSNISSTHFHYLDDTYPVLSRFHDRVLSYETGAIKPEAPMYVEAIEKIGLDPQSTLYIDDRPENTATGDSFGFHTHTYDFNNHEALRERMRGLGLNG